MRSSSGTLITKLPLQIAQRLHVVDQSPAENILHLRRKPIQTRDRIRKKNCGHRVSSALATRREKLEPVDVFPVPADEKNETAKIR
jgi:hypothetical protein